MEWIDRLNDAIDYIENNLAGEIDMEKAAELAACSSFHLQRIFPYITGVTLAEYIRRRRMTAAAFELIDSGARIIDLAARYGYESPTAFNRAFQSIHGVPPTAAKAEGVKLTAFPRITFSLSIKGGESMNYRIEKKGPIRIVGVCTKEPMTMEDCFEKIPVFWEKIHRENWIPRLCQLADDREPQGILGVSTCDGGVFSGYYVAVSSEQAAPEGLDEYVIPDCTWAIFECTGPLPNAMQSLQQRILSEWLPSSGYEYAAAPDIEVYPPGDQNAADYHSQVWLPIVKK